MTLAAHLRDAVRLNRARRPGYRRRGGLRADLLSRLLVGAERALLPAARWADAQAARHAVPVLAAELARVADAPRAGRPLPPPGRPASRSDEPAASGGAPRGRPGPPGARPASGRPRVRPHVRAARRSLRRSDLGGAAGALCRVVRALRDREHADGRYRALTIHVAESAGWMAERGAGYARQTDGATRTLSVRLVRGHLALLPAARALDRLAAPVHRRGVGLFVHDLPPIPWGHE